MLQPIHCLPFDPLLPYDLANTHYDVRQSIQAQLMKVVDFAHCAKQV